VSFVYGLAFSWQRWGNPLVDCGREMQQPLRLTGGEMLYSDVRHIYGPLSPYLNSLLYSLFGASLNVLYSSGIASAIVIIALCYWLSRQLMGPWPSLATTLSVMWLCAFKQAGNYFLPYSYNALHGCAIGLIMLAFVVKAIPEPDSEGHEAGEFSSSQRRSRRWLLLAGVIAAFAFLAKTEIGIAALTAGFLTGVFLGYPNLKKALFLSLSFALPAILVVVIVYGVIISRVGWQTFSTESYLLFQNIPPELVYFNKRMSGLDRPGESLLSMLGALLRIGVLFFAVVTISLMMTRRNEGRRSQSPVTLPNAGRATFSQLAILLVVSATGTASLSFAGVIRWDNGPYLAMPILLCVLLLPGLRDFLKQVAENGVRNRQQIVVLVIGIYAMVSLFRVILRVRSGGAYSSYLLPASVILFTYIFCFQFPRVIKDQRARALARTIAIGIIIGDAVITSFLLAYRYRLRNTYPIVTERGSMIAVPDIGKAFDEATAFIKTETATNDYVAVMPEGTSLLFFTGRKNPLREEITTPGFLDAAGEERAIRSIQETDTKLIFIANRATSEFGPIRFGLDYNQRLMSWIKENYEEGEVFGPSHDPNLKIGDPIFFLRAYRLKNRSLARTSPESD
jgi:4-amino-4-deoxy-L-arabinose transferase-like glycosyltransferase